MLQSKKQGLFITIEGVDGAGKSTALKYVETYLNKRKIDFIKTREPGGTYIAEKIRDILLDNNAKAMCQDAELLLYFASRAQHIAEIIKPALLKGLLVLSDRFTDATYAYQGAGRGMDMGKIASLEHLVQGDLHPDLVIILDIDPALGLARLEKNRNKDRFEKLDIDFFCRVRDFYLTLAKRNPDLYRVVDANESIEQVAANIMNLLQCFFARFD